MNGVQVGSDGVSLDDQAQTAVPDAPPQPTRERPPEMQARWESDDPKIRAPLAVFGGERPPAPAWFTDALAYAPERTVTPVDGAGIETLTWGERGKPGLLFLHGNGAHADWWSFIAPFFAAEHRCVAISWSGMGRSDWRDAYEIGAFADEAFACAEATGLFEAAEKPVFIAHSFGGAMANRAAATQGERLRGVVMVDSPVRPPNSQWGGPPQRGAEHRVYPDLPTALARFRLMPPQPGENPVLLDYIAREALEPAPLPDGTGEGWRWRFDPQIWTKMDRSRPMESGEELSRARCPVAVVWGDHSLLAPPDIVAYMRTVAPPGTPFVAIPDAEHHVLLDQPLALVAALKALLDTWAK